MTDLDLKLVNTKDFFEALVNEFKFNQADEDEQKQEDFRFQPIANKSCSLSFDGRELRYYNELMLTVQRYRFEDRIFIGLVINDRLHTCNRLYHHYYRKLYTELQVYNNSNNLLRSLKVNKIDKPIRYP